MAKKKAANEAGHLNWQLEDLARFPQENPNPVVRVNKDGTILYANSACSFLDGFNCRTGEVLPRRYRKLAIKVLETGEAQVIQTDGKERVFTLNFVPIVKSKYVNIYGSDITAVKKVEEKLEELMMSVQQERDRLSTLLNSIPDEVWFADTQGNFTLANPSALREFGLDSIENLRVEDFARSLEVYRPDGSPRPPKEAPPLRALKGETVKNQEEVIRTPVSGELRHRQVSAAPVKDSRGNIIGSVSAARDITELKKVEESLRETRDYLDNLINYASAPIVVWDPEFKITRFNHAFEDLTGRSSTEVVGKKVNILIPAKGRRRALARINRATVKCERWEVVEIPIRHVDGSVRTVLWNSATILAADGKTPVATIAQGLDITERKKEQIERDQLNNELANRLSELQTIMDTAPVAIWICRDAKCRTITGNIYANELFGVPPGTNVSRSAHRGQATINFRVLREGVEAKPQELPAQVAAATGKPVEPVEFEIVFEDDRRLYMLIGAVPLVDSKGHTRGAVAVGADITEQKLQMNIKDEFIGMVSHELRTPLTVIIGALSTAADERISEKDKEELIQEATSSAESLASILSNMLELSRCQAGRLELEKKPVRLLRIAERAVQRARRKYNTHNIILDISDKTPDVEVDAGRIEQVLYNLVENAVKYSPAGSEVRIFSRRENEGLVIGVSDCGIGIAPEDQQKLFEPFARLQESTAGGIGLGLVVCKRLVEAHGGRIWVKSAPGRGSTFLFTLKSNKNKKRRASSRA
jgi:PAS domain S-box-containing protein